MLHSLRNSIIKEKKKERREGKKEGRMEGGRNRQCSGGIQILTWQPE
jgi:hypothetical protein